MYRKVDTEVTPVHVEPVTIRVQNRNVEQYKGGKWQLVESQYVWDRSDTKYVTVVPYWYDGNKQLWFITLKEFKFGVFRDMVSFPGGAVDEGEEPADAARRETLEEIGLKVLVLEILCADVVEFPDRIYGGEHTVYLGRVEDLRMHGDPESGYALVRMRDDEDLGRFLAQSDTKRMLTRMAACEAYLHLKRQE